METAPLPKGNDDSDREEGKRFITIGLGILGPRLETIAPIVGVFWVSVVEGLVHLGGQGGQDRQNGGDQNTPDRNRQASILLWPGGHQIMTSFASS